MEYSTEPIVVDQVEPIYCIGVGTKKGVETFDCSSNGNEVFEDALE